MKILIICTGNSCRSQMAEGFLKSLDKNLEVSSAGTKPESGVNPYAVKVMAETGIDISLQEPKNVDLFKDKAFDYVITVCDSAKETCQVFSGRVKNRLHFGIGDPADASGTNEEILAVYRKTRDEIRNVFSKFYESLKS